MGTKRESYKKEKSAPKYIQQCGHQDTNFD